MSGIRIPQAFNNAALPQGASVADAILADARISHWFQAEAANLEVDESGIAAFIDRKDPLVRFARNGAANSPELVADQFAGFSGAIFDPADPDYCFLSAVPNLNQPYTWAGVASLRSNSATGNLLAVFTNSTTRSILNVSAGTSSLRFQRGTSTAQLPIQVGVPFAFIASYDGTNIALALGGQVFTATAAGAPGSTNLALGALPGGSQFWDGAVGDIILCDGLGVLDGSAAGNEVATKLRNFFQVTYGLTA